MALVQFRVDDDVLAFLRQAGHHPNQLAREAFHARVRRLRVEDAMAGLADLARDLGDVGRLVREARDEH